MTFGPPQQPLPAQPSSPVSALLAPSAPPSSTRTIVGAVAAVAALVLIVCSFLTWVSGSGTSEERMGSATISVGMDMKVSGMGSGEASVRVIDAPDIVRKTLEQQVESQGSFSSDEDLGMPGIWTIIFGVIVAAGAALLLIGRYPGIGAVITVVGGLAATIAAIVFVSDPVGAVDSSSRSSDTPPGVDVGAGYGLWLVLVGALAALAAGAYATLLTVRPGSAAASVGPFGAPGQPQQFGQPGQPQQFGQPGQPQQFGQPGQPQQFGAPGQPQQFGQPGQSPQYGQPGQPPQYGQPGQPPQFGQPGQPPQTPPPGQPGGPPQH